MIGGRERFGAIRRGSQGHSTTGYIDGKPGVMTATNMDGHKYSELYELVCPAATSAFSGLHDIAASDSDKVEKTHQRAGVSAHDRHKMKKAGPHGRTVKQFSANSADSPVGCGRTPVPVTEGIGTAPSLGTRLIIPTTGSQSASLIEVKMHRSDERLKFRELKQQSRRRYAANGFALSPMDVAWAHRIAQPSFHHPRYAIRPCL